MAEFSQIMDVFEPRWVSYLQQFAVEYEAAVHRIRSSWIPATVPDELWRDLYRMAEMVERDIALM